MPSTTQFIKANKTDETISGLKGKTQTVAKGIIQMPPSGGTSGNLTTMSIPVRSLEVLNILYSPAVPYIDSPKYDEVPFENLAGYEMMMEWNNFIENFKQITIKIFYITADGREVRINEFSRMRSEPNFYKVSYNEIFNYLKRNRLISQIESWRTYRFKITGEAVLEQMSSNVSQNISSLSSMAEGRQMVAQQVSGPQGAISSTRTVLPTNSFEIYLFVKGQEDTNVDLPSSNYQQLQTGIEIYPEEFSSEGKFKITLKGREVSRAAGKEDEHWKSGRKYSMWASNFYLVIEDAGNPDLRCSCDLIESFRERFRPGASVAGGSNRGKIEISGYEPHPYREFYSCYADFSLLNDLLTLRDCRNKFPSPEGKTFKIWAYADVEGYEPDFHCFIYSLPYYITLYRPEDIPSQTESREYQDISSFKPQTLVLNHNLTNLNLPLPVTGAKININEPLNISWRDNLPTQSMQGNSPLIYFVLDKFVSNSWQNQETIEHQIASGQQSLDLFPSVSKSVAGGFKKGIYRLKHYYLLGPFRSQDSDWVYFESVCSALPVDLRFTQFTTTPRRNHHSLSFRLQNFSPYDLTNEYVANVRVGVMKEGGIANYIEVPTPIRGMHGESAGWVLVELPENCDLDSNVASQKVTLSLFDTELWKETSLSQTFTVPVQDRSNLYFQGSLSFSRSNDGNQIIVNFRTVEDLRGKGVFPYKIKLRVSKQGGRIIHEEEFLQHAQGSTYPADPNAIGPTSRDYPLSFILNKDDILRKSGGERHLALEVILDWENKYAESNESDNLISGWYNFN